MMKHGNTLQTLILPPGGYIESGQFSSEMSKAHSVSDLPFNETMYICQDFWKDS